MDRFSCGMVCFLMVFATIVGLTVTWLLFFAIGSAMVFYGTCFWLLGGRIYVQKNNRVQGYYQWFWYVTVNPY